MVARITLIGSERRRLTYFTFEVMSIFKNKYDQEIINVLRGGGVGILRTDTLYGFVASANNEQAVERVYAIKDRSDTKSPIVLVSSLDQLFEEPSDIERKLLDKKWPGKVSVILPSQNAPAWIERGNHSVAYRMPDDEALRRLIARTGPLIAPSANPQGADPAMNIDQAISYFGDAVDFYIDGGEVFDSTPSQLLRIGEDGEVERLR